MVIKNDLDATVGFFNTRKIASFKSVTLAASKSSPLPNTLRAVRTTSSAWASFLAKIRVFGTVERPGKISVKSLSL